MATPLSIVAFIKAKKGEEETLGSRLLALVEPSRSEPGCINYDAHQDNGDPRMWVMYENWKDASDLERHFTMPYHKKFIADLADFVDGEIAIHYLAMKSKPAR